MNHLGIPEQTLIKHGAIHTAREIDQQPQLWVSILEAFNDKRADIGSFFQQAIKDCQSIILTGAGSSSFIGISLKGILQRSTGLITELIPTTDIVTHPTDYFRPGQSALIISFARSGNSPESVAALNLADELLSTCYHFIITCNPSGKLANYTTASRKYVFVLPPEANDQSLAMTGSYTGMLLAGLLLAKWNDPASGASSIPIIAAGARNFIDTHRETFRQMADLDFKRAVFLGAGALLGIATESHLKLQELTDGKVICKYDSYLAFRHGPKVVIDHTTLVVYLLSSKSHAYQYEKDLRDDITKGPPPLMEIAVSAVCPADASVKNLFLFSGNDHMAGHQTNHQADEDLMLLYYVLPAQLIGFYKSLQLGLQPDQPSVSGAITRVVEGVHIYEMPD